MWTRHLAELKIQPVNSGEFAGGRKVFICCARCQIELPLCSPLYSPVLTRGDVACFKDDVSAVDCHAA